MVSYLGVVRTVMMADTAQFNRAVAGASMQFRAAAARMRTEAQSLVGISGALNLAITIPAVMAARSIAKLGITYESNMQKIKHVAGMTQKQLETLNKAQIQLSKDTRTRPSELAKVGYMAAQAQILTPSAIREVQKAVAMAQKVQPGDAPTETVAAGLIANLKAFKVPIQDSVKTIAEMTKTVDLGRLSWEQYSKRITQVAAVAANIGGKSSFKNMNIALALATQGGVQGGEAATALRNLYLRIYERSNKKNSVLNLAAVSAGYKDAADMFERGAGGSLTKYMQMLSSGFGTARGATAAGFLRREITSALTLMNASFDEWQRYEKEYDSAFPDFKRRYEEFLKSPIGILLGVQAAFERVKLSSYTAIGPMIIKFLEGLEWALNKFANLPNIDKQLIALTIGLASIGTALASIWGVIQSITLTHRLNKILGAGAASGVGPLDAIDPFDNAARLAAAKLAKAEASAAIAESRLRQTRLKERELAEQVILKAKKAEASAAIAESRLRQTLLKERELAERAILKAKKAEAATAAKQAGDAARAAVVSRQLQAAILQAKASAAGFTMPRYRGALGHPPGFVGNLLKSKKLLGAPPPPLFPFMPDWIAYTPMETSWHGFTMPNYTGPKGRTPFTINMVQLPDGSFGRRLQRPLLGEYGSAARPRVYPMQSIPGAAFYNAMYRPRRMPSMPSMGGTWGAIKGAMTKQRNLIGGGQCLAIVPFTGAGGSAAVGDDRQVKPPRIPRTGFFGKIPKGIFGALGGMLKFLGVIYIISVAFRALREVLAVTLWPVIKDMFPSIKSLGDAFNKLGEKLKVVDEFIVYFVIHAFAGVAGTLENLFGAIVGGVMTAISAIKFLWSGLTMWFRDSVIGRKLNINPTAEELAEYEQLKKDRWSKTTFWAQYAAGQFKGMFGGEESAVTRILDDIMERRNKRAGVELGNIKKRKGGGTPIDDALAAAYGMTVPSQSPGFFEYGTLGGYEARVAATDAIYEVMKELKDKSIKALEDVKAELERINEREDNRDLDGALLGVTL
jgi:hypothetical protein